MSHRVRHLPGEIARLVSAVVLFAVAGYATGQAVGGWFWGGRKSSIAVPSTVGVVGAEAGGPQTLAPLADCLAGIDFSAGLDRGLGKLRSELRRRDPAEVSAVLKAVAGAGIPSWRDATIAAECGIALAAARPAEALELAVAETGWELALRRKLTSAAVANIADTNPAGAEDLALSLMGSDLYQSAWEGLVRSVGRADPRAALGLLDEVGLETEGWKTGRDVFDGWFQRQPQEAREFAEARGRGAGGWLASAWAKADWHGALAWAATLEDPGLGEPGHRSPRRSALVTIFRALDTGKVPLADAGHALEEVAPLWGRDVHEGCFDVLMRWVPDDPDAAVRWVDGLADPDLRGPATSMLVKALAIADPDRALSVLDRLPDDLHAEMLREAEFGPVDLTWSLGSTRPREMLEQFARAGIDDVQEIGSAWFHSDPVMSTAHALEHWNGAGEDERWPHLAQAFVELGKRDPEAALALLPSIIRFPSARQAALGRLIDGWAMVDAAAAAGFVTAAEESIRPHVIKSVAHEWAQADPASALEWVRSLVGDPAAYHAIAGLVAGWVKAAPDLDVAGDAGALLEAALAAGHGPAREALLSAAFTAGHEIAGNDPEAAVAWATSLGDPAVRDRALQGAIRRWAHRDSAAATQFAANHMPTPELADTALASVANALGGRRAGVLDVVAQIRDPGRRAQTIQELKERDGDAGRALSRQIEKRTDAEFLLRGTAGAGR